MAQAPAGWYPQPDGRQRYWDGFAWTDHFWPEVPAGQGQTVDDYRAADAPDMLRGLHRKCIDALNQNLAAGETVRVVIKGTSNQAIIGTERRAFVFKKGMMAGASFGSEMTSWAYQNLVGIQLHTGMVSGAVVLQGPGQTGSKTSYWSQGKDDPHKAPNAIPIARPFDEAKAGVARLRELIDDAHRPTMSDQGGTAATRTQGADSSIADELRKLAELRDRGVLSPEEFESLKARLLS